MSSSVLHSIIEWVTAADVEEVFSMSKSASGYTPTAIRYRLSENTDVPITPRNILKNCAGLTS